MGLVIVHPEPTRRADQAERTRQAVLSKSRQLFAERGYAATSLQQIADATGVRKANVYYYFRTKAAILDALLDERVIALESLMDAAAEESDRKRRVDLVIDGFVEQVIIAHRSLAPIDFADPAIRGRSEVTGRLDALSARAVQLLFGDRPTTDEIAGFALVQDLKPVLRAVGHLPDEQLGDVLRQVCRRLLPG